MGTVDAYLRFQIWAGAPAETQCPRKDAGGDLGGRQMGRGRSGLIATSIQKGRFSKVYNRRNADARISRRRITVGGSRLRRFLYRRPSVSFFFVKCGRINRLYQGFDCFELGTRVPFTGFSIPEFSRRSNSWGLS